MVKKISGRKTAAGDAEAKKQLHARRLRLKSLHQHSTVESNELRGLPADQLPPASSSNAARQARSRLNITFPVDWQKLHLSKHAEAKDSGSDESADS